LAPLNEVEDNIEE
jgi:hypothetical protein